MIELKKLCRARIRQADTRRSIELGWRVFVLFFKLWVGLMIFLIQIGRAHF